MLPICKLPFLNGSYRNGVCRALWAKSVMIACASSGLDRYMSIVKNYTGEDILNSCFNIAY